MRRSRLVYSVTRSLAQVLFSVFYRIHFEKEGTLPEQGPVVILPKHQYWTDIPIVSLAFRPFLYFVAKRELFEYSVIRRFLLLLGGLPIDRKQSIKTLDSFRSLLSLLKAGEMVVLFPEGTYVRGEVGPGKSRLIQLILTLESELGRRIPFIPVGIRYGERRGWRRRVEVRIGHPLFMAQGSNAPSFTQDLMKEIGRLSRVPWMRSEFGVEPSAISNQTVETSHLLPDTLTRQVN